MLNFVCKEQAEIFKPTVRLFPMNFPPKQGPEQNAALLADSEVVQLHFKEELDDLQQYLEETQFKLDELNADDFQVRGAENDSGVGEIKMASLDDLKRLRESLAFLKTQVVNFNHLCSD